MTDLLIEETAEAPEVRVVSEPLTYRLDTTVSFFKDFIDAKRGQNAAIDRLARHSREMEQRTHPDRTAGFGGNFAPPLWLIDRFASVPRASRVLANLIPNFPLPDGVPSVNVPRLTAGMTTTAIADDTSLTAGDITDAAVTAPVVTIAGFDDVSLQLLDQSPPGAHLDQVLFKDLSEAYDQSLEQQLIYGTGSGGQVLGLMNVSGINAVTYTAASPTATAMFTFFGQAVAAVGINRLQPPETWLMTTARAAWIASSEDSQMRPLMVAGAPEPGEFQLVQYPVHLDDAIQRNLGAGTNQDAVILCKPSDMLLLESQPHMRLMFEPGSGTLEARIELHRYVAAILGRYPTGIAVMQGTGFVTPTGF